MKTRYKIRHGVIRLIHTKKDPIFVTNVTHAPITAVLLQENQIIQNLKVVYSSAVFAGNIDVGLLKRSNNSLIKKVFKSIDTNGVSSGSGGSTTHAAYSSKNELDLLPFDNTLIPSPKFCIKTTLFDEINDNFTDNRLKTWTNEAYYWAFTLTSGTPPDNYIIDIIYEHVGGV